MCHDQRKRSMLAQAVIAPPSPVPVVGPAPAAVLLLPPLPSGAAPAVACSQAGRQTP